MSDYKSVDSATYSRYEVAIIRRRRLLVGWRDGHRLWHLEPLTPRDLQTRNGAEYLIAEDGSGAQLRLRLDCILRAVTTD